MALLREEGHELLVRLELVRFLMGLSKELLDRAAHELRLRHAALGSEVGKRRLLLGFYDDLFPHHASHDALVSFTVSCLVLT